MAMRKYLKPVRYDFVVLAPGDDGTGEELFRLTSDKPFWPVKVGDEVLPRRFDVGDDFSLSGVLLRVTRVRHVVSESAMRCDHVLNIYTEDASPKKEKAG
ncbi:MAG TPA: hypothetical protein VFW33_03880 [Gemmataceae bacterium]|nr:hypothetical protein [Gemmataceae bacterium]